MGVAPDFGTEVDGGKGSSGMDPDIVKDICTEGSNEVERMVGKVGDARDVTKEVMLDKFFLWNPKFLATVVDDGVLVRVAVNDKGTSGGGEEVGKKVLYQGLFM